MGGRAGVCLRGDEEGTDEEIGERSPVTQKNCRDGLAMGNLAWSSAEMQGWRESMEDAHLAISCLREVVVSQNQAASVDVGWNIGLFGVLDGHGGFQVAKFCERHLPEAIASRPSANMGAAMAEAFVEMDQQLKGAEGLKELRRLSALAKSIRIRRQTAEGMGTTAVVCCVGPTTLVVANAGDSRAVLCRRGQAIDLSQAGRAQAKEATHAPRGAALFTR
ncbi:unnamed protein product [Effrenium voratum]|nr:unnamed protein product [Effrenium voratum]